MSITRSVGNVRNAESTADRVAVPAREADIGIAGARGEGLLFMKGKTVRKVPEATMVEELKKEIDKLAIEMAAKREAEANA